MATLNETIEQDALFMKDVTVQWDKSYGYVTIKDDNGVQEDIFLEGGEGSTFLSQMRQLWNETQTLTETTIALHLAKPYVENIWN